MAPSGIVTSLARTSSSSLAILFSVGTTTAALLLANNQTAASDKPEDAAPSFQIESDLMDRIANKPYLLQSNKRNGNSTRPLGVPRRLRVMSIDVPPMRYAFDGECRFNLSRVYLDDVAPPKTLTPNNNNEKGEKIRVAQKAIAKALIRCRKQKRIGVELLETSVADLNPHNLRRTHQFGNYRYDPGKYSQTNITPDTDETGGEKQPSEADDATKPPPPPTRTHLGPRMEKDGKDGTTVPATEEDELDAPWNQYAWIEELEKRIHGKVAFGEALEPASSTSRLLFGNVYQSTVPSSRRWWEWFLPGILHHDPAGTEAAGNNWASHKPHAVIANGASMQRVPGAMRFLQRTCQEANVPLFIVNDPRVWGATTHQGLEEALQDMRRTIKQNIVMQALRGAGSSAFAQGRLVGQLEIEAQWQAKDMGRRTRQAIRDANKRLEQERENDWSGLNMQDLQKKLVRHKVIQKDNQNKNAIMCTDAMTELAKLCMGNNEESAPTADTSGTDEEGPPPPAESLPKAEVARPQETGSNDDLEVPSEADVSEL